MKSRLLIAVLLCAFATFSAACSAPTPTPYPTLAPASATPIPPPTAQPQILTQVAQTLTAAAPPGTGTVTSAPPATTTIAATPYPTLAPASATPAASATATGAPPEPNPPAVQLTAPPPNSTIHVNQPLNVTALASDEVGISRVELWADGVFYESDLPPGGMTPQTFQAGFTWQSAAPGTHTLYVLAYDTSNNPSQPAPVNVIVQSDNTPPTAQLLAPTTPQKLVVSQNLIVQATSWDATAITRLDLWVDGQFYSTATPPNPQTPFSAAFTYAAGTVGAHTLFVRAYDVNGLTGDSAPLSVTVSDNSPPVIHTYYSATVVRIGAPVTVNSNAVDQAGITKIELWADGVVFNTVSSQNPAQQISMNAQFVWSSNQAGNHSLFTVVHDVNNNQASSPPTIIQVLANPPTPSPTAAAPTPVPQAPSAYISSPGNPFNLPFPNPVRIAYGARGSAGLTKVLVTGKYGMQDPFVIRSVDLNGQTTFDDVYLWTPPQPNNLGIQVEAIDRLGRKGYASASGVLNPPAPQPPSVQITAPGQGFTLLLPGSLQINYSATGQAGLTQVQLYAQYSRVMAVPITTIPLSGQTQFSGVYPWNNPTAGSVQIFARAVDRNGRTSPDSTHISGIIRAPIPPAPTPTPRPTPHPAQPGIAGAWGANIGSGSVTLDLYTTIGCTQTSCSFGGTISDSNSSPPATGRVTRGTISGRSVHFEATLEPGSYTFTFDGTLSADGRTLSGTYFQARQGIPSAQRGNLTFERLLFQ